MSRKLVDDLVVFAMTLVLVGGSFGAIALVTASGCGAAEPTFSSGPDASEILGYGFRIYDPQGWGVSDFQGEQCSQDLLRAGFFIYDPKGRQVDRFLSLPSGWSHASMKVTRKPPLPRGKGGPAAGKVWPTVRSIP